MDSARRRERARTAMLGIGGGVGLAAMVAPGRLTRLFGLPAEALTPAGRLGWRLFAARNLYLTARAARGSAEAEAAFGHLQVLDQAVFWSALARSDLPRRTSAAAIGASTLIVVLDQVRRRA